MPPREENKEDLAQDVGCRHIEVVFEGWDGDVAIYLRPHVSKHLWFRGCRNKRFVPCTPDRPSRLSAQLGSPFGRSDRS